jgi:glycosyltransferase involved in cell wall biosynthesis
VAFFISRSTKEYAMAGTAGNVLIAAVDNIKFAAVDVGYTSAPFVMRRNNTFLDITNEQTFGAIKSILTDAFFEAEITLQESTQENIARAWNLPQSNITSTGATKSLALNNNVAANLGGFCAGSYFGAENPRNRFAHCAGSEHRRAQHSEGCSLRARHHYEDSGGQYWTLRHDPRSTVIRVHLKSPSTIGTTKEAFSFGRVHHELELACSYRDDIMLVDSPRNADMQVCWCQPYQEWEYRPWYRREHDVQVIYTTFECTSIPKGWDDEINKMAALFTTSNFTAQVFKDNGIEVPIHLVPHGVNADKFGYVERDWNEDKPLYFIWQGVHPSDRKGLPLVHQAWRELDLKNAYLIEKWHPLFSRRWHHKSEPKRFEQFGLVFQSDDYKKLMAMCHVSINPTRAEGFGMLPLEAAATGMATAVTNWSGCADYIPKVNSIDEMMFWPITYEICAPGKAYFSTSTSIILKDKDAAQDALPNYESVKESMRFFYENRDFAQAMGKRASEYVHTNWNWNKAADAFVSACKSVLGVNDSRRDAGHLFLAPPLRQHRAAFEGVENV